MIFETKGDATAWGQAVNAALILLGFVVNGLINEWRARAQWKRDNLSRDEHAREVERKVTEARDELAAKVDRSTETSEKAFIEANAVNAKIAQLSKNFNKLLERENDKADRP